MIQSKSKSFMGGEERCNITNHLWKVHCPGCFFGFLQRNRSSSCHTHKGEGGMDQAYVFCA